MKKTIIIIGIIFIFGCSDEEVPITLPETIRVQETVIVEVTKVVEKEKVIYLDATYNPEPTWTSTPTPVALPAWTPTAIPLSLPTWTPTPTPKPGSTWTPTPTPTLEPTWTPTPTPTQTPVNWEFYKDGKLVTPTPKPAPTWTSTPTPKPASTWTPTPTPTPLPPGDLGYELIRQTFNITITDVGQILTIGIPLDKSPVVDSNRNNSLIDEIKIITDPQNYTVMKVSQNRDLVSEVTIIALTPVGNTNIVFDYYTTKK